MPEPFMHQYGYVGGDHHQSVGVDIIMALHYDHSCQWYHPGLAVISQCSTDQILFCSIQPTQDMLCLWGEVILSARPDLQGIYSNYRVITLFSP